jgi:two-component system OmpR family response regulator
VARPQILIVEDDPDLRRMYRLSLTFDGLGVREAADGIEALRVLEQHAVDLVLLDLDLPRLGGLSVQQELAARVSTQKMPVVIVTALDLDLRDIDVECVLRKPVTPQQLVRTVRRCLQTPKPIDLQGLRSKRTPPT